ncbi:AAA family ATPase [Sulfitobacter sp. 1A15106]|uniref:ATP-binding protein n=1 Tax=Sulfitobacter sp. 1A15106 TaxID=3368590 RepID=UPI003745560B
MVRFRITLVKKKVVSLAIQLCHIGIQSQQQETDTLAISLSSLKKVRSIDPPRVLVYGPPGTGKTSIAAEFPRPVFIQTEDGTPGDLELDSFGLMEDHNGVMQALGALAQEEHDFKTLVVDTLDSLEPLIQQAVCDENGWASIEDPGFGKGYIAAEEKWMKFLRATDWLRRNKGMNIVFLGHSDVTKFDPPGLESYSRYSLRLNKRAANRVMDDMDIVGFLNFRVEIKSKETGFGKTQTHAEGGGTRWMYVEERPAHSAKNRYGLQPEIPVQRNMLMKMWGNQVPIAGLKKD